MCSDGEVKDPPQLVCEHERDIEHLKSNGGDSEEVDGNHPSNVVLEEGAPGLGRRTASADQIFADGALANPLAFFGEGRPAGGVMRDFPLAEQCVCVSAEVMLPASGVAQP